MSEFANIQYDAVGNMLSVSSTVAGQPGYGGTTSYAYDQKNELTGEQSSTAGGYGYDGGPSCFVF